MKTPENQWVITHCADPEQPFMICGPRGEVHLSRRPSVLAKIAWNNNADSVKFDFDLNLDPDK